MHDKIKTKCPTCGAPAHLHISTSGLILENGGACVLYEYNPPRRGPAEIATIMGYDVNHLLVVAELLRKQYISPEELRDLCYNFEEALRITRLEMAQVGNKIVMEVVQGPKLRDPLDEWDLLPSSHLYEQAKAGMARLSAQRAAKEGDT